MAGRGLIAGLALAGVGCLFVPPPGESDDPDASPGKPPSDGGARPVDAAGPGVDAAELPALVACPATADAPVLDGVDEAMWSGAPPLLFQVIEAEHIADLNAGYQRDASVSLRCLHDDDRLYFFIDATDGVTVASRAIQIDGPDAREDDAVVLFLHDPSGAAGAYDDGDHALLLPAVAGDVRDGAADFGPAPLVPSGEVVTDADGYRIEIAINRVDIAAPLADRLLFNLAMIDDDGFSDTCRDVFALLRQPGIPCIECCSGEDWTGECVNYSVGEAQVWCDTRVSDWLALE